MKRTERRLLEEKLRYVAMEEIELDPERERQMLEAAKAKFMQQSAETDAEQTSGWHGMGRRVLIVSAAAVLLLVLSFGFTVLMPESVSHARGFVRTAAIWVNDTLHLGYEFDEPTAPPAPLDEDIVTYATLEEAAANIPYPLVYLDDPSLTLRSVTTQYGAMGLKISIFYGDEIDYCKIELTPMGSDSITSLDSGSNPIIHWERGELMLWETNTVQNALTYYSNMEIYIKATNVLYDDFLILCQKLKVLN